MFCAFLLRDFKYYSIRGSTQCTGFVSRSTVAAIACNPTSPQLVAVFCCACERSTLLFTVNLHQWFSAFFVRQPTITQGSHLKFEQSKFNAAVRIKYLLATLQQWFATPV